MKKVSILLLFVFAALSLQAQTTITTLNCDYLSSINTITTDNNNIFISGLFKGNMTLSGKKYGSPLNDNYLLKMDKTGNVLWFFQGSFSVIQMKENNGDLYVLGQYNKTLTFNGKTAKCGSINFFLSRLGNDGKVKWLKSCTTSEMVTASAMDIDKDNNIVILCRNKGNITLETKKLNIEKDKNEFLAKYDADGNLKWASTLTGGNSYITGMWGNSICCDPVSGKIYVGGDANGSIKFGTQTLNTRKLPLKGGEPLYARESYIAVFNSEGSCTSLKTFITEANLNCIKTDSAGNLLLAGWFTGEITGSEVCVSKFGTEKIKSTYDPTMDSPSEDGFIAKFAPDGKFIWVARGLGKSTDRIQKIALDKDGYIYGCGMANVEFGFIGNTKKVGPKSIQGTGEELYKGDFYIVQISPEGEFEWAKTGGGTSSDMMWDICSYDQEMLIGGFASGSITFDGKSVQMGGKFYNGLLIKL